jgi:hypothetical protein
MKASARTIKETLENCGKRQFVVTPTRFIQIAGGFNYESDLVSCERHGERVTIKHKNPRRENIWENEMYYCNGLLMDLDGLVFKRI